MSETRCNAKDCNRSDLRSRGLCTSHYVQWQARQRPDRICEVDACDKQLAKTSTRRVCEVHYRRMRLYGSYDEPPRSPRMSDRACAVAECDRKAKQHDYCAMHAERWRNHGDPRKVLLIIGEPEKRFWAKVLKTETCWLWTGWCNENGYGQFTPSPGEKWSAHRWIYTQTIGPIPDGFEVDHVWDRGCCHRNCVNPEHLEAVTPQENQRRMRAAVRERRAG